MRDPVQPEPPADLPADLRITHASRVIDPTTGLTKGRLVGFHAAIAPWLLPGLRGRPTALLRAPGGVGQPAFFQKHPGRLRLPGVRTLDRALWPGHEPLFEITNRRGLLGATQMNAIEFHPWNARTRSLGKPDRMVFDLDPGEGSTWQAMRSAATELRRLLRDLGLQAGLKTSGGKGLHLIVPLVARHPVPDVAAVARAVAEHLAEAEPDRYVARAGAPHRVGRVFIDHLRNGEGATTVAAYSVRARPGMGVSMPIPWEALADVERGDQYDVTNTLAHLAARTVDPWRPLAGVSQGLARARRALAV